MEAFTGARSASAESSLCICTSAGPTSHSGILHFHRDGSFFFFTTLSVLLCLVLIARGGIYVCSHIDLQTSLKENVLTSCLGSFGLQIKA